MSENLDRPTANPYSAPRAPNLRADRTTGRLSLAPGVISIICGGLTAFLGVSAAIASNALAHDDFDLFFTIFLGGSCLVWPLTLIAFAFGLAAGFRKTGIGWIPFMIGTGLCCTGITFVVIAWR